VICPVQEVTMVAERRKVVNRAEAERLLDDWDRGGLPLPAFCAERGVDGRSLQCWAMNLGRRERDRRVADLGLVEVGLAAPRPAAPAVYRVLVGDIAVEVDDAFEEETLTRILRVVSRC
jgi:hypothetical protein